MQGRPGYEALSAPEPQAEAAPGHRCWPRRQALRRGAVLLASAGALAGACGGGWRWGALRRLWPGRLEGVVQLEPQCEEAEADVDYWTATNLAVLENVGSSGDCLARCASEGRCGAWTWGAPDVESPQLQNVCFLKPAGENVEHHPKAGVISGLPCRRPGDGESGEQAVREQTFQPIKDCHQKLEDVDLLGSELMSPIEGVLDEGACQAACEGETHCGAWTWGRARDTRWLTDVCFLKTTSNLGQLLLLSKKGVVSGFPCRGPQASHVAPSAVSNATSAQGKRVQVLTDCREQEANIDYWTSDNLRIMEDVRDSAACSDMCEDEPACGAWTWGSPTCPKELHRTRCYLKALDPKPQKIQEDGLISGVPCRPGTNSTPAPTMAARISVEFGARLQGAKGAAARGPARTRAPRAGDQAEHHSLGNCHAYEVDVDYMAREVSSQDGVQTPESCQERCEEVANCSFWTWGKVRGWVGLSDVCFFKAASQGHPAQRYQKYGVVSGVPCEHRGRGSLNGTLPKQPEATTSTAAAQAAKGGSDRTGNATCAPQEVDIDFVSKKNLDEKTGVESAEACRLACERDRRCGAWTWGTRSAPTAMAGICFLKPADPQTWRYPLAGIVSGLPCRTAKASFAGESERLRR